MSSIALSISFLGALIIGLFFKPPTTGAAADVPVFDGTFLLRCPLLKVIVPLLLLVALLVPAARLGFVWYFHGWL